MFPIKMLEYTEGISVAFSLAINIAYGMLLDYALQIARTLPIGNVCNYLFAFTLLSLIPRTTICQLQGTQSARSVIRHGFVGLSFILQTVLYNRDGQLTLRVLFLQPLVYVAAVQMGFCVYYCAVVLFLRWQEYKFLALCFVCVVGALLYLAVLFGN